ncbi:MAG: ACP S-malonyltransferase, partial [Nitrospirae bacterium]|nr:ACP S-malonyltransferase [Nitrospirota bacterium]
MRAEGATGFLKPAKHLGPTGVRGLIARLPLARLRTPLINNADAAPLTDPEEIRSSLLRQLTSAVRWDESIRRMGREGCRLFVEIGPGRVLSGLVKRILPDAEVLSVSGLEGLK